MESVEVSGKSVEEAVQQALLRLGKTRDEVDVTVVSEGHRGILGFVRGDGARVRVTVRKPEAEGAPRAATPRATAPRPTPSRPAAPRTGAPRATTARPAASRPSAPRPAATQPARAEQAPVTEGSPAAIAREMLEALLGKMSIGAEVVAGGGDGTEDAPILLDVTGDDLGILIGRRGETLASLQFLLNLMVGKRLNSWVRVLVDVESYRARREEALRSLAQRVAERVRQTGQAAVLEPMPPNERRIVHLALQDDPLVTTESTGYGEERRVTVLLRG